ncbi:MAG: Threonine-tRNA ligase [Candidatus Wolfebacteria bacterium GW2011_GWA2_42_10]|uniref:Threonine--tRNA ligase n=2 Tax=Candidatus Wolfeibacteriota TaxID=1752735 RepID=A0A0G0XKD6_9BACT|nr:MAG: Threonine-tRNA ligase [Candidatus Wolfebacteria bacterium GW2011_GWB1_41_12]KKS25364.1 MAG: Threonine-tRNA ligase [Candidatus Wolfebacteria bacterium GW2011_GWA2_42_10]KKT56803.1 MAG: Threonine-tRNA ligase [Candidatus Wolfebacteria bacterium GW2011_GWA1_44_24]
MRNEKHLEKIRHSLAHLLAMAVLEKFPKAKLGIGPVIENGFYYDFGDISLSPEDLPKLENRMRELIKQNLQFKKEIISTVAVKKLFKNQPYKLELAKELQKTGKKPLTVYKTAKFSDLCVGPHIKSTSEIDPNAFKLTKLAGAYWRGSEKNPMLTRIYGAAFETRNELAEYEKKLSEAERCDHRNLGERLEFFMIDEEIGKGLPLWLPKGYSIRRKLENYIYDLEEQNGYLHILTSHIAKEDLYKKSGHLAHYKEDMYAPIAIDNEKYYLKPMNCPHHHSIYKHHKRSYRELPLRLAEFGTVYRHERSGVLSGLIRVRGFTQNDAHVYTYEENLENEIVSILKLHKRVFDDFNINDYWYRLSLPDFKNKEKFGDVKNKKMWQRGALVLEKALKNAGHKFIEAVGEASFYGPKIDIQIKDIWGKEDTIATIQVDYYSAPKFNLNYIGKDGKEKPAIIIHRAIFGSFDRFFAFLIEKTCGNLPLWLAPIQVKILAISEKQDNYAQKILTELKNNGVSAELAPSNETLGKRIRESELQKIPYILIIGEKEVQTNTVAVRSRKREQNVMNLEKFLEQIKKEIKDKK